MRQKQNEKNIKVKVKVKENAKKNKHITILTKYINNNKIQRNYFKAIKIMRTKKISQLLVNNGILLLELRVTVQTFCWQHKK